MSSSSASSSYHREQSFSLSRFPPPPDSTCRAEPAAVPYDLSYSRRRPDERPQPPAEQSRPAYRRDDQSSGTPRPDRAWDPRGAARREFLNSAPPSSSATACDRRYVDSAAQERTSYATSPPYYDRPSPMPPGWRNPPESRGGENAPLPPPSRSADRRLHGDPMTSDEDDDVREFRERVERFSGPTPSFAAAGASSSSSSCRYGDPLASSSPNPYKTLVLNSAGFGSASAAALGGRRQTLPSIVRYPPPTATTGGEAASLRSTTRTTTSETYVYDNGVRRRLLVAEPPPSTSTPSSSAANTIVASEATSSTAGIQISSGAVEPTVSAAPGLAMPPAPPRYRLESTIGLASSAIRCSMPDVTTYRRMVQQRGALVPREQVAVLSQKRRDEIRQEREDDERRQQQQVIFGLNDIKARKPSLLFRPPADTIG